MSGYETLLENYNEMEKFRNPTFSSISESLDSLTAFVNEDVDFNVMISLTEAENGLKDKAATVKKAVVDGARKLAEKLKNFIIKIKDTVAQYIAKAKEVIANKGNKALAKLIASGDAKLVKSVKLNTILKGQNSVSTVFDAVDNAIKDLHKLVNDTDPNYDNISNYVNSAVEALKNRPKTSSASFDAGNSIRSIYKNYVGDYIDLINTGLSIIKSDSKTAIDDCNTMISMLKEVKDSDELNNVSKISSAIMRLQTGFLNFAFYVLSICTKNSAKLALASGQVNVNNNVEKAKKAGADAADKVKGAADSVKGKFQKK